jgi:hypothetical protein
MGPVERTTLLGTVLDESLQEWLPMTTWILNLLLGALAASIPTAAPAGAVRAPVCADRAHVGEEQPSATVVSNSSEADSAPAPDDGRGTPFVVLKADNICGLDEPRQITTPAKVDYDALLAETTEVKELKRNGIDPTSSKGITLLTKARSRVLKACETVRTELGYDSIWKSITRRDSRAIPDATDSVKAKLGSSGD